MRAIIVSILLLLVAPFEALAGDLEAPLPAGAWTLSGAGEHVSLHANRAPLNEILEGLRDISGARLRFGSVADRDISMRLSNAPISEVLRMLDVSYVLTYVSDEAGEPRLEGAWVSVFESAPPPPPGAAASVHDAVWGSGPQAYTAYRVLREGTPDGRPGPPLQRGVEYRAAMPVQVMVDGNVDDWPDWVPWQEVSGGITGQAGDGSPDASFAVAAVADEASLYFAVKVRDDKKAAHDVDALRHQADDQLRFALETINPDGTRAEPTVITMRRHHVLVRDPNDPSRIVPGTRQVVRNSQGVHAVILSGDDGWSIEMGIPFDRLGIDATAGPPLFGFDVVLEDHDKDRDTVQQLAWRRTDRLDASDAGETGRLRVVDMRPFLP